MSLAALLSLVQSPQSLALAPVPNKLPQFRKSWESASLGSLGSLNQVTSAVPDLRPDEALVQVRAIGLNFADIFCVLGLYAAANAVMKDSGASTFCPGLEFSGTIIAIGSEVTSVKPGDRVFGFTRFGAWSPSLAETATVVGFARLRVAAPAGAARGKQYCEGHVPR